jgi:AcrR family transcriptional regulator
VSVGVRKPAAQRREEILRAAEVQFAATGLSGTRLEPIAAEVGVSHPRVVQMFGTKHSLFLEVVRAVFDRVEAAFEVAEPTLAGLGDTYRKLLRSEPTVGLVMLQSYAAAADATVRKAVRQRQLGLERLIADRTGADARQVRTFFAAGLALTVSAVLELSDDRADMTWGAWILDVVASAGSEP